jgi:hypothetical protein
VFIREYYRQRPVYSRGYNDYFPTVPCLAVFKEGKFPLQEVSEHGAFFKPYFNCFRCWCYIPSFNFNFNFVTTAILSIAFTVAATVLIGCISIINVEITSNYGTSIILSVVVIIIIIIIIIIVVIVSFIPTCFVSNIIFFIAK